eukprot:255675-Pelagomonas_calceolata.AAC.11
MKWPAVLVEQLCAISFKLLPVDAAAKGASTSVASSTLEELPGLADVPARVTRDDLEPAAAQRRLLKGFERGKIIKSGRDCHIGWFVARGGLEATPNCSCPQGHADMP